MFLNTPIPWQIHRMFNVIVQDADGQFICETNEEQDAETIVRAINAIPFLIEALRNARPYVTHESADDVTLEIDQALAMVDAKPE